MEFQDVLNKRRTIRDFSNKSVDYSIIQKAIDAGFKAPSYNHLKEWYFIIIENERIKQMIIETEEMSSEISEQVKQALEKYEDSARNMYLEAIPKQRKMILEAPCVIAIAYKPKTFIKEAEKIYDVNCIASIWCCIENLILSLAEDNVFGVTFIPKNTSAVKRVLNIPDYLEIATILPIGYLKENVKMIKQKEIKILNQVYINKWGNSK